ncbi:YigZ family protein [Candidatus Kapabacteria bacterium]|nr:YigZ family protein [Candidatus Kapabacteria bacterium]
MADYYYTIESSQRAELKIEKSRFIANVCYAPSPEIAKEELDKIKVEFYDARHNCFAYRIGPKGMIFRAADDGEPNGTGGKPILFAIKKYELSDIIVIVTRYFGGKKLGKGGLARAYGDTAVEALKLCTPKKIDITRRVKVFCTYEEINVIKRLLEEYAVGYDEIYTDSIDITARIPSSMVGEFVSVVDIKTNAKAGTRILDLN